MSALRREISWIEAFKIFGRSAFTAPLWLEWGALWCLSISASRQLWHQVRRNKKLYPNLYVLPVGKPGTGKGEVISVMRAVLDPLERFTFAPNSATRAAMLDYMQENKRTITTKEGLLEFHEMLALNDEFTNLVPEDDNWYMTTLNEIYDCRDEGFTSRTRGQGAAIITNPYAALFAAVQPAHLQAFPEAAWNKGFMSRAVMVQADDSDRMRRKFFEEYHGEETEQNELSLWLRRISSSYGCFTFSPEARHAIDFWLEQGMPPAVDHPKLEAYTARRLLLLVKLTMLFSLSDALDLVVQVSHVKSALDLLFRTEARMPQIFLEMSGNQMSSAMQDVASIVRAFFLKHRKGLEEGRIIGQLAARLPASQVTSALNIMVQSKMVTSDNSPIGFRRFFPGTVKDSDLAKTYEKGEG